MTTSEVVRCQLILITLLIGLCGKCESFSKYEVDEKYNKDQPIPIRDLSDEIINKKNYLIGKPVEIISETDKLEHGSLLRQLIEKNTGDIKIRRSIKKVQHIPNLKHRVIRQISTGYSPLYPNLHNSQPYNQYQPGSHPVYNLNSSNSAYPGYNNFGQNIPSNNNSYRPPYNPSGQNPPYNTQGYQHYGNQGYHNNNSGYPSYKPGFPSSFNNYSNPNYRPYGQNSNYFPSNHNVTNYGSLANRYPPYNNTYIGLNAHGNPSYNGPIYNPNANYQPGQHQGQFNPSAPYPGYNGGSGQQFYNPQNGPGSYHNNDPRRVPPIAYNSN